MKKPLSRFKFALFAVGIMSLAFAVKSCSSGEKNKKTNDNAIALPVYTVDTGTVVVDKSFLGTVEGKINVEIRPQVTGELVQAYVDEGDYVEKGQKLFKINPQTYQQNLYEALAAENVAKANLNNAQLEVERLKPLVENQVIAPIRLEKEQSNYAVAQANLRQAKAQVASAQIMMDFTVINAPVSGYIGRIPKRIGNVVSPGDKEPITVLSDVHEVYVYFSMNESDFFEILKNKKARQTANAKGKDIDTNQTVSLILANGTEYPEAGVIDASSGQINKNTGAITMRASFSNESNILRSGNTGTLIMHKKISGALIIPQKATFELQAITFVKKMTPEGYVKRQKIDIQSTAPNNRYIVSGGLNPGDRILVEGMNKVNDSTKIKALPYRADSIITPKSTLAKPDSSLTKNN